MPNIGLECSPCVNSTVKISTLVFATNKVLVLHTVDQEEAEEDQGTWTETSPAPVRPAGDPQDELQGPPQPITAQ